MSGICGLFNFDGVHVSRAELAAMATMLEAQGPDGTGLRLEGIAGLGHALLTNTPDAACKQQPVKDPQSGCLITADIRLDNREELLDALGLAHRQDTVSDAQLLLSSYLLWGEHCVDRLLGDFAFAIFDPRRKKLFCARDPFGLKPLYYHRNPDRFFAFASSPQSIMTLPQVPYRVNDGRIADFLVPELEWIDYTSTFFEGVYRLPPGHKLAATPERFEITEYWSPRPGPELGFSSETEWQAALLEVLTTAIDARLRAPVDKIGAMLSGGLDSGSIAYVAKDLLKDRGQGPLVTFSAMRRSDEACAESRAIRAVQSLPGLAATAVNLEDVNGSARQLLRGNAEPFDGEAMLLKAVYHRATAVGISVVLDGAGGDVVLNEGSYLVRLLRRGRIDIAVPEIVAQNRFWGAPGVLRDMVRYGRAAYVPDFAKRGLRPIQSKKRISLALKESLVSHELADVVNIGERFERIEHTFSAVRHSEPAVETVNAIRPNVTAGRERYARLAAAFGCEARDPYLDRRLVELAARVPEGLRLRNGWPKLILRRMMADRLPDDVRWLRGKPHLGWLFNAAVSRTAYESGDLTLEQLKSDLSGYVDQSALTCAWRAFAAGYDHELVHSANVLAVWLLENANRPVERNRKVG